MVVRKLGIDYGARRTGLAISDVMGIIATPLETFVSQGMRQDIDHIARIVNTKQVDTVVIGMPYNMDGTTGKRAKSTEFFGQALSRIVGVPVVFRDERLTTVEAYSKLAQAGLKKAKQKDKVDQVSAQIILQEYIDSTFADKIGK
ncbi:MAG: Holliday junction resolvase RuvX [Firmicutes bacterium]|nr:Holliday junction resolvase RuvX [Bacillota bacterium]